MLLNTWFLPHLWSQPLEVAEPSTSLIEQSVLEEGEVMMDMETEVEVHTDLALDQPAPGPSGMKRKLDFDTLLLDQWPPFDQDVSAVSEVEIKQESLETEGEEVCKKRLKLVSYWLGFECHPCLIWCVCVCLSCV